MIHKKSISINDVAQAAGVSVSTVSRVLNNKPDVAVATRNTINEVIANLGYEPYVFTSERSRRKTRTIAVHYPLERYGGLSSASASEAAATHSFNFFGGMGKATREMGYTLNIITTSIARDELLNLYNEQQIDGLIIMETAQYDWRVNLLREQGLPFVMIGQCANNSGLDLVDIDHVEHTRQALEHLIELGHRHIALLGYPQDTLDQGFTPAVQVREHFAALCHQYGLSVRYRPSGYMPRVSQEAAQSLLEEYSETTAIITAFAAAIPGALRALLAMGRTVPKDCSVTALLSTRRESESMIPTLTALDFPMYEMGYRAVNMLLARLADESVTPMQVFMEPQLIVRESTGKVPGKIGD